VGTETAEFAGQLRGLKERSGRSYGVLAGQLHMSVATLHRYCHGDAVPRDFTPADRLARRCGATPDELVELHRRWILADEARRRSRGGATGATSSPLAVIARPSAPAAVDASAGVLDSAGRTSDTGGESLSPVTVPAAGTGALVGREAEVERTAALVRMADGTDPVLIVTGDPGAGKAALLDGALHTARAAGMRVLRADGAVPEAEPAFSGLHQLLGPVLAEAEGLPVRQRDALLTAFGMNTREEEHDPLLIGLAAGALLSRVALRRRLLVVVDDAQWIDEDSLRTLGFVARRLHGPQVALLIAARDTTRLTGLSRGRHTLELGPLDLAAVRQLLDQQRCPPTGPRRHPDPAALVAAQRARWPDASPGELLAHLVTDAFTEGSRRLADARAARSTAGTYAYLFRWRSTAFGGSLGACHCAELPFVFDRTDVPGLRGPQALLGDGELPSDLASHMHRAWNGSAATGDPGWAPYRPGEDRTVQVIDERWRPAHV